MEVNIVYKETIKPIDHIDVTLTLEEALLLRAIIGDSKYSSRRNYVDQIKETHDISECTKDLIESIDKLYKMLSKF